MSLQLNNIQAPLNAHGMVVSSDRVVSGDWPDHSPVTGDNITLIGRVLLAATLAGSLALGGGGLAQSSKPIVGISTVSTFSNGDTGTRKVSPSLVNFNTARVGDTVSVGFEDRLTFVLSGPRTKVPAGRDVGVAAGDEAIANWWVTAVDPAVGKVSLVNPAGGAVRTYTVSTPDGREQLPRVKPGDYLRAIDKEVLVVLITPKA